MRWAQGKVVHLTSVHDASDTRILHKECATLAEHGYEVTLIAPGAQREGCRSVRHRSVPAPRGRFERMTRTVWQVFAAALSERARVYHFHDPELILAGIALRLLGARVVYDVHEDVPLDIGTKPWIVPALRPLVALAARAILGAASRGCTAIVPATPSIARTFAHRRVVVVRNYPRIEEFEDAAPGTSFEERPPHALYLGSITLVRGLVEMVEAMADPGLPDPARLVLAGPFEDDALRERASQLRGWGRVRALGHVPRSAVGRLLAQARLGLLLLLPAQSHEEAMPTKLFEYMGAGLPVIVSKSLGCGSLIAEYDCGVLVDPRDASEVAAAMNLLLFRPELARAMGERGRCAVRERFAWSNEAAKLLALYGEIA